MRRYYISSMLDSSCGSMHWMPLVLEEAGKSQPGLRFMGTDVVCMLIDRHKQSFANHTNWDFKVCLGKGGCCLRLCAAERQQESSGWPIFG